MAVTSFQDIKSMSASFRAMLNSGTPLPFNAANTQLVILADVATDLQTILQHNPAKLALVIGLENERLTVCLLGADAKGKPLTKNSVALGGTVALEEEVIVAGADPGDEELPGEEAWPEEQTITNSENSEYDAFFGNP